MKRKLLTASLILTGLVTSMAAQASLPNCYRNSVLVVNKSNSFSVVRNSKNVELPVAQDPLSAQFYPLNNVLDFCQGKVFNMIKGANTCTLTLYGRYSYAKGSTEYKEGTVTFDVNTCNIVASSDTGGFDVKVGKVKGHPFVRIKGDAPAMMKKFS